MTQNRQKPESLFSARRLRVVLLTASIPAIALVFVIAAFVWAGPRQSHETAFAGLDRQSVDPNEINSNSSVSAIEDLSSQPLAEVLPARVSAPEPIDPPAMLHERATAIETPIEAEVLAAPAALEERPAPTTEAPTVEVQEARVAPSQAAATSAEIPVIKSLPAAVAKQLDSQAFSTPATIDALHAIQPPTTEAAALPEAAQTRADSPAGSSSLGARPISELLTELASMAVVPLPEPEAASAASAVTTEAETPPPEEALAVADEPAPPPAPDPVRRPAPAPAAPAPRLPAPIPTVSRIAQAPVAVAPPPAPAPAVAPPAAPVTTGLGGAEQQMLAMHNSERARAGLPPLALDATLMSIARRRATDMASRGYFSHVSPTGETAGTLVNASGLGYRLAAENIARNDYPDASSASAAMSGFMGSPTHRANVMNPALTRVGIAVVVSGSWKYYAVEFLQP
jgi:uncharacterized protein YkwD